MTEGASCYPSQWKDVVCCSNNLQALSLEKHMEIVGKRTLFIVWVPAVCLNDQMDIQ